jgi:isoquinoline 1-oxidoreductase alpha subunit
MTIAITVNGERLELDAPSQMPLLWALREVAGLTGTKYGCGIGICGACTVHVDGAAERACVLPIGELGERRVVTIEGLGKDKLHPVQRAWIEENVAQCGYCQPGFIMQVTDLLANSPKLTDAELMAAVSNVCRCGTYTAMRSAIAKARGMMGRT